MAVLAEKEETMNKMIRDLNLVCEEYGMRINKESVGEMCIRDSFYLMTFYFSY